jgi:hypothetical protein
VKKAVAGGAGFSHSGCTKEVAIKAKFEWLPGPGPKNKFTSTGKSVLVEDVRGGAMACTAESSAGEYVAGGNNKTVKVKFRWTGCTNKVNKADKCSNTGVPEEVVSEPLEGELGVEKAPSKIGLDLQPEEGFEQFAPSIPCEKEEFDLVGLKKGELPSVIRPIRSDKMVVTELAKFEATKGKQKPEKFEGGPKDVLYAEQPPVAERVQTGLTQTETVTGEESIEVKA